MVPVRKTASLPGQALARFKKNSLAPQGVSVRIACLDLTLPFMIPVLKEFLGLSDQPVQGWSQQHGDQTTDNQELIPADCDEGTTGKGTRYKCKQTKEHLLIHRSFQYLSMQQYNCFVSGTENYFNIGIWMP
jgi:hypothetical protein